CRWMGESEPGGMRAIRWSVDGTSERPRSHPHWITNQCARSGGLLAVDSIEFLDHLVGQIDGVFVVDHNLDRLFAALIDDDRESTLFRHGLCGRRNSLHVVIDQFLLLSLQFLIK